MSRFNKQRKLRSKLTYGDLENRRLLATVTEFDAGILSIRMNAAGDTADVDTNNTDKLTVNGQLVQSAGVDLGAELVTEINIFGNNRAEQLVDLDGFFDFGVLERVSIVDVSEISINGDYQLSGDFVVDADNATGFLIQDTESRLDVGGNTNIEFASAVGLIGSNNFEGTFSAQSDAVFVNDINDIRFGAINSQGGLVVTAGANVSQTNGTSIVAKRPSAISTPGDINLPNSENDFTQLSFSAASVSLSERNTLELVDVTATGNVAINTIGDVLASFENEFNFNGNFQSTNPRGSFLNPIGSGMLNDGKFEFEPGDGLRFDNDTAQGSYYVEMDVTFDNGIPFYNKLLDFKNRTSDAGLYLANKTLSFYRVSMPSVLGQSQLEIGQQYTIGLQRSDGIVIGYVDGHAEFSFVDNDDLATYQFLHFFLDDRNLFEARPGSVEGIRIAQSNFAIGGNFEVNAGGDVDLRGATFSVAGNLSVRATNVDIRASGDMKLRDFNVRGNASISTTGKIIQSGPVLKFSGESHFNAHGNINLSRPANDFVGTVSASAQNIVLKDQNNIQLKTIQAVTAVVVQAENFISNTDDARLTARRGDFIAREIRIGNRTGDDVNFGQAFLDSARRTEYFQDSSIRLLKLSASSSIVSSTESIFDSAESTIDVSATVIFNAPQSISLGDTSSDSVETGQVVLRSDGYVGFDGDGDIQFTSTSFGKFMRITADGAITDSATASINARNGTLLRATSVVLGDQATDSFNARAITLETTGNAFITEDSDLLITGVSTVGGDLTLSSSAAVLDSISSFLTVNGHFRTVGDRIFLGDRLSSFLSTNSFSFNSNRGAAFQFDSPAVFARNSVAQNVSVFSTGAIGNLAQTNLDVSGRTSLTGTSIRLGHESADNLNTTQIEFRTNGTTNMEFDSGVVVAGESEANSLRLRTPQFIADANTSSLVILGHSRFIANNVAIGEQTTDRFETGSLSFVSGGSVSLSEDNGTRLFGESSANRLVLRSTGNITDDPNAETIIQERATLSGIDLIIGELATDCFDVVAGPGGLFTEGANVDVTLGC